MLFPSGGGVKGTRWHDRGVDEGARKRVSKLLSRALRHDPAVLRLELEPDGWAGVDEVLAGFASRGTPLSLDDLREVVASSDKRRFAFSPDGARLRANQGHSIPIDLGLAPVAPPPVLLHGTVAPHLDAIEREGLRPMGRRHVHLSPDLETATAVGRRRGRPVIVEVDAAAMHRDGYEFRCSDNGVWLTDAVPPGYLARRPT
jgi:putative RNA 2'-phosphotransferase